MRDGLIGSIFFQSFKIVIQKKVNPVISHISPDPQKNAGKPNLLDMEYSYSTKTPDNHRSKRCQTPWFDRKRPKQGGAINTKRYVSGREKARKFFYDGCNLKCSVKKWASPSISFSAKRGTPRSTSALVIKAIKLLSFRQRGSL